MNVRESKVYSLAKELEYDKIPLKVRFILNEMYNNFADKIFKELSDETVLLLQGFSMKFESIETTPINDGSFRKQIFDIEQKDLYNKSLLDLLYNIGDYKELEKNVDIITKILPETKYLNEFIQNYVSYTAKTNYSVTFLYLIFVLLKEFGVVQINDLLNNINRSELYKSIDKLINILDYDDGVDGVKLTVNISDDLYIEPIIDFLYLFEPSLCENINNIPESHYLEVMTDRIDTIIRGIKKYSELKIYNHNNNILEYSNFRNRIHKEIQTDYDEFRQGNITLGQLKYKYHNISNNNKDHIINMYVIVLLLNQKLTQKLNKKLN